MKKFKSRALNRLFSILSKEVSQNKKNISGYGRREFISKSVKGAAAFTLISGLPAFFTACNTGDQPGSDNKDILDVAILGGGMAGLNCANHLLGSDLKIKIFEADRRMGGRILTHTNDSLGLGIFPEFGGDFIDTGHQDMLELAKEFKLELHDLIEEQEANHWIKDIYFFNGRKISEKEIIREFKKIAPKIARDKASLGEDYDTAAAQQLDNTPLSEYINSLKCAGWLKELLVASFIAEFGLDCEEQSTINMMDMIDTNTDQGFKVFGESDERFRIKGGNSKIIEGLVKKIGGDKISKSHFVKSVIEQTDGMFQIHFENGSVVKAKAIVCTIPFSILRNIKLDLKNITDEKRKCINELGYGKNTKLVLGYTGQPWRNKENQAMGYLFTKDMTNGWDGSENRTSGNKNGAYVAYFGGTYSQKLCDESFKNPMAPPTHLWRTGLPEEKVDGLVNKLEKIFINSKKDFAGKHVFVNWIDYPFVKASYSCYKTGQWTTIAGLEVQPVGNFYFAGEHCSEMFQGFMNGAAETGRRVAEMILKRTVKRNKMKAISS